MAFDIPWDGVDNDCNGYADEPMQSLTTYRWDGNGNLLSDGTTNYTWDARDRLALSTGSGSYGYDANNLRTKIGAQKVLLDGIEEAREYGANELRYDHDPSKVDGLLAQKSGASKGYFVTDALGSVYAVVDSTGTEVSKYSYDVYGARTATTEGMVTSWGYTGRRHDRPDFVYSRSRNLDANSGHWTAPDALGFPDGPNTYQYVTNQPTNSSDPSGFSPFMFVENSGAAGSSNWFEPVITAMVLGAARQLESNRETFWIGRKKTNGAAVKTEYDIDWATASFEPGLFMFPDAPPPRSQGVLSTNSSPRFSHEFAPIWSLERAATREQSGLLMLPMTLQFIIAMIASAINDRLQRKLDYVEEERRILREQLDVATGGKKLSFSTEQRRRLATAGKLLTPDERRKCCHLVKPGTILAWFREFAARKYDSSEARRGRPPKPNDVRELVIKLATENLRWG
jgi:RHS repeat-associated protein